MTLKCREEKKPTATVDDDEKYLQIVHKVNKTRYDIHTHKHTQKSIFSEIERPFSLAIHAYEDTLVFPFIYSDHSRQLILFFFFSLSFHLDAVITVAFECFSSRSTGCMRKTDQFFSVFFLSCHSVAIATTLHFFFQHSYAVFVVQTHGMNQVNLQFKSQKKETLKWNQIEERKRTK